MRTLLAVGLAALLAGRMRAQEQWDTIAQGTRGKVELDLSRLRRSSEGTRDVWIRMSFDDEQQLPGDLRYRSTLGHMFLDCKNDRIGNGAHYWLDKRQMIVLSSDESRMTMHAVVPESPGDLVSKHVCAMIEDTFQLRS